MGGRTLTVLGCDGSYPGPGGAASGYLVRGAGTTIWLDAGPGTFAALQRHLDPGAIDAVVLSHEHPDHWSDLESFAVWLLLNPERPSIPVYAPPGLRARSYFAGLAALEWIEAHPSDTVTVGRQAGGFDVRFVATDHGPPTLASRFAAVGDPDPAHALAYSADTGPDWTVAELGHGIGTFLCEATYTVADEGSHHHLSGRQAGSMAAEAGVDRLVVTHRWPTVSAASLADEAGEAFGRGIDQAAPDATFEW